jgi:2-polyprenyl-6-methoxyphenol hydroxylase-like FAD-dependent oxidoreductase
MKAVICGAGIAGLSLAQRLTTIGWDVVIIEKSPGPREQGYMMDFFGLGYDAAQSMGLLPRLRELSYRIEEVRYVDESGRRRAGLNYVRFERAVNGRLLSIMRPDLELALRERVVDKVDLRYGCGIAYLENSTGGVQVTLTEGTVIGADLLIGADGIHSTVRRTVFGEEQFLRYLGFHTAAYIFDDPQIYDSMHNRFCLTDTAARQMGFYGLRDGKVGRARGVLVARLGRCPGTGEVPDVLRAVLRPGGTDRDSAVEPQAGHPGRRRLPGGLAACRAGCFTRDRWRLRTRRAAGERGLCRRRASPLPAAVAAGDHGEATGRSARSRMAPAIVIATAAVTQDRPKADESSRSSQVRRHHTGGKVTRQHRRTQPRSLRCTAPDAGIRIAREAGALQCSYFFFVRVAPPRPRSVTPDSESTRCTKPYDRPVDSASARILAPFSYFFFRSDASLSRATPVIRLPFFRSATSKRLPFRLEEPVTALAAMIDQVSDLRQTISGWICER